jgi:hypothetical protein
MKLSTIGQQKGDLLKQVTPLAGLTVFSIHDTSDTLYIFQNNLSFYPLSNGYENKKNCWKTLSVCVQIHVNDFFFF